MQQFVDVVIPPLEQPFSYILPTELESVDIGYRVNIPFGKRSVTGFVVAKYLATKTLPLKKEIEAKTSNKKTEQQSLFINSNLNETPTFKSVESIVGDCLSFRADQMEFFEKVASYYGDKLANVIDVATPPYVARRVVKHVTLLLNKEDKGKSKSTKRPLLIEELKQAGGSLPMTVLTKKYRGIHATIKKMLHEEIISIHEVQEWENEASDAPKWAKREVDLNAEQKSCVEKIAASCNDNLFQTFLLHGVTGSGKTEVYIEAIQQALSASKGVLIIVPEIALTPQLVDRFRARLGGEIAVLHSGLNPRTRWESWRSLIEKRCFIALGARSAVFAPVPNLGLIIVDEEHDHSFKQGDGLRYNARDVAVLRGHHQNCPVVLGSATPSLESFHRSGVKKYRYLSLPSRHAANQVLNISVVDLNKTKRWLMPSDNITPELYSAIEDTLRNGEQAFLLYNRRGFASYLQCETCSYVCECHNCSVTLTYHQSRNMLLCHYCGLQSFPGEYCPNCDKTEKTQSGRLVRRGGGTEKVFDELKTLFPLVSIERLDRDIAQNHESYNAILSRVRSGETSILVGTQMIAKGHDLPNVTLVGIVDCDVGLHMPDFRASERVFQLLTQAAGRAGRGDKLGRVIFQTRLPNSLAVRMAAAQDYREFALQELQTRMQLLYPPFSRLLRIVSTAKDANLAETGILKIAETGKLLIEKHSLEVQLIGPAPAPLERLKGQWRWHLLLKSKSAKSLNRILQTLRAEFANSKDQRITFDVDPQDMM